MAEHFDWLSWFAGLVDGEGCFSIRKHAESKHFQTRLYLQLRDDDLAALLMIQETLKMGTVSRRPSRSGGSISGHPSAVWRVHANMECQRLVVLLDSHPLQTRKAQDYAVWREAVLENQKPSEQRDIAKMTYLCNKIRLIRRYEGSDEVEDYKPSGIQLAFPEMKSDM